MRKYLSALWQLVVANNKISNSLCITQLIWLNMHTYTHKYMSCCMEQWQSAISLHARLPLFLIHKRFSSFSSAFLLCLWRCMQPCVQRKLEETLVLVAYRKRYITSFANSAAILLSNVNFTVVAQMQLPLHAPPAQQ